MANAAVEPTESAREAEMKLGITRNKGARWAFVISAISVLFGLYMTILSLVVVLVSKGLFNLVPEGFHLVYIGLVIIILAGYLTLVTVMNKHFGLAKYLFASVPPNYVLVTINVLTHTYVLYGQGFHPRFPWEEIHATHHISLSPKVVRSDDGKPGSTLSIMTKEVSVQLAWQVTYAPKARTVDLFFIASRGTVESQLREAINSSILSFASQLSGEETLSNTTHIARLVEYSLGRPHDSVVEQVLSELNFTTTVSEAVAEMEIPKMEVERDELEARLQDIWDQFGSGKPSHEAVREITGLRNKIRDLKAKISHMKKITPFSVRKEKTRQSMRDIIKELVDKNSKFSERYGIEVIGGSLDIFDADYPKSVQEQRERDKQLLFKQRQMAIFAGIDVDKETWKQELEALAKGDPGLFKLAIYAMNLDNKTDNFRQWVIDVAGVDQELAKGVANAAGLFANLFNRGQRDQGKGGGKGKKSNK